jgi:hypothetical protein
MRGLIIELMLITIGAVAGAFLRYRITSSPLLILDALQEISEQIPVCIISSKDYFFLKETRAFAKVLSCMMGIETVTFTGNTSSAEEEH